MRNILSVSKKLLGRKTDDVDPRATWTKRLFDEQGNTVEITDFDKFYFASMDGRWVSEQFPQDGSYWLVYNSNEADRPYGSSMLIIVGTDGSRRWVGYTVYSLGTPERDVEAYEADPRTTVPEVVKTAIRELVPARV